MKITDILTAFFSQEIIMKCPEGSNYTIPQMKGLRTITQETLTCFSQTWHIQIPCRIEVDKFMEVAHSSYSRFLKDMNYNTIQQMITCAGGCITITMLCLYLDWWTRLTTTGGDNGMLCSSQMLQIINHSRKWSDSVQDLCLDGCSIMGCKVGLEDIQFSTCVWVH